MLDNRDIVEQIISNALTECEKAVLTVGEVRRLPKLMEIRIEEQLEISQGYIDLHIPRQEYLEFCKYSQKAGGEGVKVEAKDQVSLQNTGEQLDDARIVVLREKHVKRLIDVVDEIKELTDFLREQK